MKCDKIQPSHGRKLHTNFYVEAKRAPEGALHSGISQRLIAQALWLYTNNRI